ncbi:MAG: hypothetical protein ACMUIE_04045 [Thermoplasmatota archaeon]
MKGGKLLAASLLALFFGGLIFLGLLFGARIGMLQDVDKDGISDIFQKVQAHGELFEEEGEWRWVTTHHTSELNMPVVVLLGLLLLTFLPSAVHLYLWYRPVKMKISQRREEEGMMHDQVRRMAAFLEVNPSLQNAVRATQVSLPDGEQRILGPLIWSPFTTGAPFSEVFTEYTADWRSRSAHIGEALSSLGASVSEKDSEKVSISARRTINTFDKATRDRIREYSRSLGGPTTALFAVGVMLPLMLAILIPLMGLSASRTIMIGALLWVVIPMGIISYGNSLVGRRPLRRHDQGGRVPFSFTFVPLYLLEMLGGILILTAVLLGGPESFFRSISNMLPLDPVSLRFLAGFVGASLMVASVIGSLTHGEGGMMTRDRELRSRAPRAAGIIGMHVQDGLSFPAALRRVASSAEGDELRMPPYLPGDMGYIDMLPPHLADTLRSAEQFSRSGPEAGGRAIKALSSHLEELNRMEIDLGSRIRASIGQMGMTASLFAPLMVGSSVGIFSLLERSGSNLSSTSYLAGGAAVGGMELHHFLLLSSGYLAALVVSTTITLHRLENGTSGGGWYKVPGRLVISSLSFAAAAVLSSILVG